MDAFGALADPVRRSLLCALATGPRRVVDLADAVPISRPAVSRHLRLLTEAGLVAAEDRGRERHYALRTAALRPVAGLLAQLTTPPGKRPTGAIETGGDVAAIGWDRDYYPAMAEHYR